MIFTLGIHLHTVVSHSAISQVNALSHWFRHVRTARKNKDPLQNTLALWRATLGHDSN